MQQTLRKLKKYTKTEVEENAELLQYIYVNNDECFVMVRGGEPYKQRIYPINSLKEEYKLRQVINSFGKNDVMFSLNPFRTMKSTKRNNLFCINAIAVDVDYKKIKELQELKPGQVIKLLEMDFFDRRIPTPNFIEYGNQIRLIYGIETCYIPKESANVVILATRVSKVFAEELKEYGADKQNLETYFRIPGGTNTKNGAMVKMFAYDNSTRYTLRELQELWLDEVPKWYKRKKGRQQAPKKVIKLHNIYSFNCNRLRDFETIQAYLNKLGEKDLRARLCFLYRNYVLIKLKYQNGELKEQDHEYAEKEMLKFNSKFRYPLRENVIESATRSVNKLQYRYKNDTLVNFLELDYELCEKLGLQSIYRTKTKNEVNKDQYKKRLKVEGKTSKKKELEQRRVKIKDLLQQGLNKKDICIQVNISKRTYDYDVKHLKEQGLI